MELIELCIAALVGLAACLCLIPLILRVSHRHGFAAEANELHHTHNVPVPRFGGIALVGGLLAVVLVFGFIEPGFLTINHRWLTLGGSLAMFGLGLWDDFFALGARRKLAGQLLIASAVFFLGIGINRLQVPFTGQILDLGLWGWPITVIWLVAMTNLINLIDGVDGLAGGICLMLMVLLAYVTRSGGFMAFLAAGMVGSLLGFLRYNFPPARIYMGDGGAYFLGFLIGCLTIVNSQKGTVLAALAAPLFVLALPIIDTSLAILRRGLRGLPLFRPDKKHIHHRLLAAGYSRRGVVLGLYGFTAFFLVLGFFTYFLHGQYFALLLGIGTLSIILAAGRFNFSREWLSLGRLLGNSLESRAEIQYALSLSRWLALEGARAHTVEQIVADVVFVARKLDFGGVRMRLKDVERVWQLKTPDEAAMEKCFHYQMPRQKQCFLELCVYSPGSPGTLEVPAGSALTEAELNILSIQAELVAEAWSKALKDWQKLHQLPLLFENGSPSATVSGAEPITQALSSAKTTVPAH